MDSNAVMCTNGNSYSYAKAINEKPFSDPIKLLSKQDLYYNMNHVERGCFMIFNYKVSDVFLNIRVFKLFLFFLIKSENFQILIIKQIEFVF